VSGFPFLGPLTVVSRRHADSELWSIDVHVRSVAGQTALFWAAANHHSEVVKLLLDRGPEQTHTDNEGRSPASIAQLHCWADVIHILTEHNAQKHRRPDHSSSKEYGGRKRAMMQLLLSENSAIPSPSGAWVSSC
jgi:hypothetical protein